MRVTFDKKSYGEGEVFHADWHQSGRGADQQDYSIDPEEQVHGAVLPVHQLNPGAVLRVVEVGVRPAHHKLFDHYTCGGTTVRGASGGAVVLEENSPTKEPKTARPPSP